GRRPRHRAQCRPQGRRAREQPPPAPARPQGHRPLLRQGPPPADHQPVPGPFRSGLTGGHMAFIETVPEDEAEGATAEWYAADLAEDGYVATGAVEALDS